MYRGELRVREVTNFGIIPKKNTFFTPSHSIFSSARSSCSHPIPRVRKGENFPDSKIFVTKTFRIKRVNRVNFRIRDTYAYKVFLQILSISMVQICSIGCIYKINFLKLSTLLITLIEFVQNFI